MDLLTDELYRNRLTRRQMLGGMVLVAGAGLVACTTGSTATKSGTVAYVDIGLEPPSLNGLDNNFQYIAWPYRHVHEMLYNYDPATLQSIPWLAAAMPKVVDDLHTEVTVKPGIFFHNGDELTAEHVAATYNTGRAPGHVWNFHLLAVQSVDAVDKYTVRFTLSRPWGLLLDKLTVIPIIHKDWVAKKDSMMGTGPFVFADHVVGSLLRLKANTKYRTGTPALSEVVFRFVPDSGARLVNLLRGDSTVNPALSYPDVSLTAKNSAVQVGESIAPLSISMRPNCKFKPFDDVRVRQALGYSMNRTKIRDVVFGGRAELGQGPIGPGIEGWDPNQAPVYPATPDFERAKSLLRDAGIAEGQTISFPWIATYDDTLRNLGAVLKADWAQVGFNAQLQFLELAEWGSATKLGAPFGMKLIFDMNGTGLGPNAAGLLLGMTKGNPVNTTSFNDDDVTALIQKAETMGPGAARAAVYSQVTTQIAQKGGWLAPAYPHFTVGYLKTLQGMPSWEFKLNGVDLTHARLS